ncbi:MAG: putative phosphoserine phosphatase 2 [Paracidovorax wautersii]|uniref:Putative phosphoserine phosphatase 2 n=1 Tax=Paracidovorax wautersii TaxID=1177982 RepID=A0A7V8FP96_9BURK|nr:MAG: putative phosphoserine phosphatase 2 [Paracidovorax wautersii]
MTDLILIRHGETDWNRQLRFQGHSDVPLNSLGHEQARRLAAALADEPIVRAVSSDLVRTQQTAAPLLERLGLTLTTDPLWREQAFGDLEGLRVSDMAERHPQLWARWLEHDPDFRLPGPSESRRQFHERAVRALLSYAAAHARWLAQHPQSAGPLVVFTHGGLLDMLYRTAMGLSPHGPRTAAIPNTGINRLRVNGERIEIVSWADERHLAGLPEQPSTVQASLPASVPPPAAA